MKKLTLLFATLVLTVAFTSCQKENLKPQTNSSTTVSTTETTPKTSSTINSKVEMVPVYIKAISYYDGSCYPSVLSNGTKSKFIVQLDNVWSGVSAPGLNLFVYYRTTSPLGLWVCGGKPQVFTFPQYFCTVPNTFINGKTYEVKFDLANVTQMNTPGFGYLCGTSAYITVNKCVILDPNIPPSLK